MDLTAINQKGHFTKAFDPDRRIPDGVMEKLIDVLHAAPSSVNVQGWHFIVASTEEAKQRIVKDMRESFIVNLPKVEKASHVIVFCTRMSLHPEHLEEVFAQEHRDGRFPTVDQHERWKGVVREWIALHEYDFKDLQHWMEKQTYLALGIMLMAAAELGIDVAPLEGFDPKKVDAEFGLREMGFTSSVLLSLGYRDTEHDYAVNLPKSRLPKERVFTFL